jgi:hypothetical protein
MLGKNNLVPVLHENYVSYYINQVYPDSLNIKHYISINFFDCNLKNQREKCSLLKFPETKTADKI